MDDFEIVFGEYTYSTSGVPLDASAVWPSSGEWAFDNRDIENGINRSDGVFVGYGVAEREVLQLSIKSDYPAPYDSVYVFHLLVPKQ